MGATVKAVASVVARHHLEEHVRGLEHGVKDGSDSVKAGESFGAV